MRGLEIPSPRVRQIPASDRTDAKESSDVSERSLDTPEALEAHSLAQD